MKPKWLPIIAEYSIPLLQTEHALLALATIESLGLATEKSVNAKLSEAQKESLFALIQNKFIEKNSDILSATRLGKLLLDRLELSPLVIATLADGLHLGSSSVVDLNRILVRYRESAYVQYLNSVAACRCWEYVASPTTASIGLLALLLRDVKSWLNLSKSAAFTHEEDEKCITKLLEVQPPAKTTGPELDSFRWLAAFSDFQVIFGLTLWFQHWWQLMATSESKQGDLQANIREMSQYTSSFKRPDLDGWRQWWSGVADQDSDLLPSVASFSRTVEITSLKEVAQNSVVVTAGLLTGHEHPSKKDSDSEQLVLKGEEKANPNVFAAATIRDSLTSQLHSRRRMNVLITGGAGFIGSHLAEHLIEREDHVNIIDDLSTGSVHNIKHLKSAPNFNYFLDSITNQALMAELIDAADIVYHLAAVNGMRLVVESPLRIMETNIRGAEVVLGLAAKKKKRVLIASSADVYGKRKDIPLRESDDLGLPNKARWIYGWSKAIDEVLAGAYWREKALPTVIARLFNVVGPRQTGRYGMVIPNLIKQALTGRDMTVYGDGTQTRCFTYISDAVSALVDLAEHPDTNGEAYNIGSAEEVSILALAEKIRKFTGSRSRIVFVPYDAAYGQGFEDVTRRVPDLTKINRLIGYIPMIKLDEILLKTIRYHANSPTPLQSLGARKSIRGSRADL